MYKYYSGLKYIFLVCCIAIANPSRAKFFTLVLYRCYTKKKYGVIIKLFFIKWFLNHHPNVFGLWFAAKKQTL